MNTDCKHCHGPHDVQRHAARKAKHEAGGKCDGCDQASHSEHLAWAKKRALAYLPSSPGAAISSMISDLRKHEDWRDPIAVALCADGIRHAGTVASAREWIEGWN